MLLRQYASVLLMGGKSSEPLKPQEIRGKAILARSGALRANFGFLTASGFRQRLAFFVAKDTGAFNQKTEKKDMTQMMMTNPDAMTGMMKQQLGGLGPQLALGAFVNFFFRGFILGKLPFGLSPKFRSMLQSGIDLPSLDVSYLSSLSYYMLLLFGSRGVMTLFFQDAAVNDAAQMMQMQMQTQMGFMNPATMDPEKAYKAETQVLNLMQYRWRMEGSEQRAAALLQKKIGKRI
ncbi:putative ER membrane protein complex subunit 3 [Nannochloris sp. 'desiccata']|nr:hypothetical protein KSW81_002028 [Chlorella desiccata (nom. nud.)]KAG7673163.1 hypothetical protein KSW81_006377 [Chlorella desiccata (nom. nud.)]KAH7622586.1 putative ER membrane protein complex subunit 3 [Chlorella desiccata (nom. nud.)]